MLFRSYTRRRFFGVVTKRPKLTVYVDGPYYTDSELSIKENQQQLHDKVEAAMNMYNKKSDYEYIHYEYAGQDTDNRG